MIWVVIFIIFGLINLIIYLLLKYNSSIVTAKIISKTYDFRRITQPEKFLIEYSVNNKIYKTWIIAGKKSNLANKEIRDNCNIFVSKKYPKIIIDNKNRIYINLLTAFISILIAIIIIFSKLFI